MKLHLVLPTLLLLAAAMFAAEPMRLRAVAVIDGDTFVGSKDARVVRLWGVDAPELDQPWGGGFEGRPDRAYEPPSVEYRAEGGQLGQTGCDCAARQRNRHRP